MDNEISVELGRVRWHLAALRFEHAMLRHEVALRRLKYDPNQPRVPAGNADGGQWTRIGGGLPPLDEPLNSESGEAAGDGELDADGADGPLSINIDYSAGLTGLSSVDNATRELSRTLARTMESVDFIPEWTPQVYGTAVHVAFGTIVRFQGIPGIGPRDVEHSFRDGTSADYYGQPGSIRTDVILRNEVGDIIAIYDVKTGGATLNPARIRELRAKTGAGPSIPIIELNVMRGAILKGRISRHKLVRLVIARLWDESAAGNRELVEAR